MLIPEEGWQLKDLKNRKETAVEGIFDKPDLCWFGKLLTEESGETSRPCVQWWPWSPAFQELLDQLLRWNDLVSTEMKTTTNVLQSGYGWKEYHKVKYSNLTLPQQVQFLVVSFPRFVLSLTLLIGRKVQVSMFPTQRMEWSLLLLFSLQLLPFRKHPISSFQRAMDGKDSEKARGSERLASWDVKGQVGLSCCLSRSSSSSLSPPLAQEEYRFYNLGWLITGRALSHGFSSYEISEIISDWDAGIFHNEYT